MTLTREEIADIAHKAAKRLLWRNGDATELSLYLCGMLALLGLVARVAGVWP